MNSINIKGIITRTNYLPAQDNKAAVLRLTLAGTQEVRGKEIPFFEQVNLLGSAAEKAQGLAVGQAVMVEGRLGSRTTEVAGQKRTTLDAVANRVTLVNNPTTKEVGPTKAVVLMGGLNQVHLSGNAGGDSLVKTTASGANVVITSVAVNDVYRDAEGKLVTKTTWVTIKDWRSNAPRFSKGQPLSVSGVLKTEKFIPQGSSDTVYRSVVEVTHAEGGERLEAEAQPVAAQPTEAPAPAPKTKAKAKAKVIEDDDLPF